MVLFMYGSFHRFATAYFVETAYLKQAVAKSNSGLVVQLK